MLAGIDKSPNFLRGGDDSLNRYLKYLIIVDGLKNIKNIRDIIFNAYHEQLSSYFLFGNLFFQIYS